MVPTERGDYVRVVELGPHFTDDGLQGPYTLHNAAAAQTLSAGASVRLARAVL